MQIKLSCAIGVINNVAKADFISQMDAFATTEHLSLHDSKNVIVQNIICLNNVNVN
jgi:hypothetical protein